ncbi:hypothetical protein [Cereibacter changlensis]|uniref:hypothetical protein n=1 Tax=Cereibacter changlensis TaxID=402884 RepID=UPI0040349A67
MLVMNCDISKERHSIVIGDVTVYLVRGPGEDIVRVSIDAPKTHKIETSWERRRGAPGIAIAAETPNVVGVR